jgi:hypothetical protein
MGIGKGAEMWYLRMLVVIVLQFVVLVYVCNMGSRQRTCTNRHACVGRFSE